MGVKSTKDNIKYWEERKIDWNQAYLSTWNHPHRDIIVRVLKTIPFVSLWEVGCGPGANLVKIVKELPDKQLGGSDVSKDAIELARNTFKGGLFHVERADKMLMSDDSVDVVLSDATLIYYDSKDIKKALREIKRVARNYVLLCELHSKSWWDRMVYKYRNGYNIYNYDRLLEEEGFYDIRKYKIPKEAWEGTPWEPFGYVILAKVPKKK